jgi:hypothetical protein
MAQGKRLSDEHLREVARVYLEAHESRTHAQQAVALYFDSPISTAAKQIMQARARGFLPLRKKLTNLRRYERAQEKLKEEAEEVSASMDWHERELWKLEKLKELETML